MEIFRRVVCVPRIVIVELIHTNFLPFAEHASKADPSNDQSKSETASVKNSSSSNMCETPCALVLVHFLFVFIIREDDFVVGGGGGGGGGCDDDEVDGGDVSLSRLCCCSMLAILSVTEPSFLCCFFSFVASRSFVFLFFVLTMLLLFPNTITRIVPSSLPTASTPWKHHAPLHHGDFGQRRVVAVGVPEKAQVVLHVKNMSALVFVVSVVLARNPRSTRFFAFSSSFVSFLFDVTLKSFIFSRFLSLSRTIC